LWGRTERVWVGPSQQRKQAEERHVSLRARRESGSVSSPPQRFRRHIPRCSLCSAGCRTPRTDRPRANPERCPHVHEQQQIDDDRCCSGGLAARRYTRIWTLMASRVLRAASPLSRMAPNPFLPLLTLHGRIGRNRNFIWLLSLLVYCSYVDGYTYWLLAIALI
jgi:hypothetical protein